MACETSGAYKSLVIAYQAYQKENASLKRRRGAVNLIFEGCIYADGSCDIGKDAYLHAVWLNLQQHRRDAAASKKTPRTMELLFLSKLDANKRARSGSQIFPIQAVGGNKHKQRKHLVRAANLFSSYQHNSEQVLFEGCIWRNGDFAMGTEAYYAAQLLHHWKSNLTLPPKERPRPFRKVSRSKAAS